MTEPGLRTALSDLLGLWISNRDELTSAEAAHKGTGDAASEAYACGQAEAYEGCIGDLRRILALDGDILDLLARIRLGAGKG